MKILILFLVLFFAPIVNDQILTVYRLIDVEIIFYDKSKFELERVTSIHERESMLVFNINLDGMKYEITYPSVTIESVTILRLYDYSLSEYKT